MLKLIATLGFIVLLIACHKSTQSPPPEVETAGQKLVKVLKTVMAGNGGGTVPIYKDSALYAYDAAGRVITEGPETYTRDEKGRIVVINGPFYDDDPVGATAHVYYADENSSQVAYKIVTYGIEVNGQHFTTYDSLVYVHEAGRLKQVTWYESDNNGPIYIWNHQDYTWDDNGRIAEIRRSIIIPNQPERTSRIFTFKSYDSALNAIPQGDEVRSDFVLWGTDNICGNNIKTERYYAHGAVFNVQKAYNYRPDGRPRSCWVTINDITAILYNYYYK